tara:strand:- start:1530 stop:1865 length:336 start_codon:yes stop_codon:yes gene_type:complete
MHITKKNIHKFINGITMNCNNMGITHIDYIPDNIIFLYCTDNNLTSLPNLPDRLRYLYCKNNQLTELPKLPDLLISLSCYGNDLPYEVTLDNLKEHNKLIKRKEILKKICV